MKRTYGPYAPIPGTVSARVISHLRTLPAGAEVGSADLVRAANLELHGHPLGGYMVSALKRGAVLAQTRRVDGLARKVTFWSLPAPTLGAAS